VNAYDIYSWVDKTKGMLGSAKKEGDQIKFNCLKDKLEQLVDLAKLAAAQWGAIIHASKGYVCGANYCGCDFKRCQSLLAQVLVNHLKAQTLLLEAKGCLGASNIKPGVTVEMDPKLPRDDKTTCSTSWWDHIELPPLSSPYR